MRLTERTFRIRIKKAALDKDGFKYKLILLQAKSSRDDVDLFFVIPAVAECYDTVNQRKYCVIPT
jgi:hypothetical protein